MARIPTIEEHEHPELATQIAEIKGKRGRLSPLYATLLQSPPIASGWLHFLTAVRREGVLQGRYRELAILRVALLNRAPYEFNAHRSHAMDAGISEMQIDSLDTWDESRNFSVIERVVLAYTDAMTRKIEVEGAIYDAVRQSFSDREIVELTATIAAYNLVSRFLVALEIGSP
jgi:4-carboxymuconolactone decarboxylase